MNKIVNYSWNIALLMLYTMFFDLCITVFMSFFNVGINKYFLIISVFTTIIFFITINKKMNIKDFIISIILFIGISWIAMMIAGNVYSSDFDGNAYHKMAVGYLKNGWNPLRETSADFCSRYFDNHQVPSQSLWIDSYGKASWYFAANIYSLTGNIEAGKVYNLLAIIVLFLLLYSYLSKKFPEYRIVNIVVPVLAVLNPVVIVQVLQYYVDGFMGSMLFILIIGLTMLIDNSVDNGKAWFVIFPAMAIFGNIKFTGLAYGGIFCIVFFLYSVIRHWNKGKIKQYLYRMINFIMLAILTIGGIGYTTYVTNLKKYSNPFYPLAGEGKVDIMTLNSPAGFQGKSSLYKLFYSLFSETSNLIYAEERPLPKLKIPFTTNAEEISICSGVSDMRIGGFGVFFGGIFIISVLVIVFWLLKSKLSKTWKDEHAYVLLLTLTIIGLLITISESWWARYSPYMYLLPIIAIVILLCFCKKNLCKILAIALVIILFKNDSYFLGSKDIYNSYYVNEEFRQLNKKRIIVINEIFPGLFFNLEDKGIDYDIEYDESKQGDESAYYGLIKYSVE